VYTIFEQALTAVGGYVLGFMTAVWLNAMWRWWNPRRVRFWGKWTTDPRLLAASGFGLLIGWIVLVAQATQLSRGAIRRAPYHPDDIILILMASHAKRGANMKSRILAVLVVLLSISAFSMAAEHTKDSLDKVKANLGQKKAVLIDVRELDEWNKGHLQDAQLVPLSELKRVATDPAVKQKLDKGLPKDRIIYCHCGSGRRVLPASDILKKLGYDIRPLAAGFDDLVEAGFPAAKN
jgi:rhodanese-related sulfurtransferase